MLYTKNLRLLWNRLELRQWAPKMLSNPHFWFMLVIYKIHNSFIRFYLFLEGDPGSILVFLQKVSSHLGHFIYVVLVYHITNNHRKKYTCYLVFSAKESYNKVVYIQNVWVSIIFAVFKWILKKSDRILILNPGFGFMFLLNVSCV